MKEVYDEIFYRYLKDNAYIYEMLHFVTVREWLCLNM